MQVSKKDQIHLWLLSNQKILKENRGILWGIDLLPIIERQKFLIKPVEETWSENIAYPVSELPGLVVDGYKSAYKSKNRVNTDYNWAEGGSVYSCTCGDGEVYGVGMGRGSQMALCRNGKRGGLLSYEENKKYERQSVTCILEDYKFGRVGESVRRYVMEQAPLHASMVKEAFSGKDLEFMYLTFLEKFDVDLIVPKMEYALINTILDILRNPKMKSAEKKFLIQHDLIYYVNIKSLEKIDLAEK